MTLDINERISEDSILVEFSSPEDSNIKFRATVFARRVPGVQRIYPEPEVGVHVDTSKLSGCDFSLYSGYVEQVSRYLDLRWNRAIDESDQRYRRLHPASAI